MDWGSETVEEVVLSVSTERTLMQIFGAETSKLSGLVYATNRERLLYRRSQHSFRTSFGRSSTSSTNARIFCDEAGSQIPPHAKATHDYGSRCPSCPTYSLEREGKAERVSESSSLCGVMDAWRVELRLRYDLTGCEGQ